STDKCPRYAGSNLLTTRFAKANCLAFARTRVSDGVLNFVGYWMIVPSVPLGSADKLSSMNAPANRRSAAAWQRSQTTSVHSAVLRTGYVLRLFVCAALVSPTAVLTSRLDITMPANRQRRTALAEIRHIRYGLLNANVWAERLAPVFAKKIAAFDLTSGDKD